LVMLYTAYYIFTVGEIVPRASSAEFGISFLLESICTIVNAIIIGYMTAYMEELNSKSRALSEKINLTNTAMINLKLPPRLKAEISRYIYNTHTTKLLQTEMDEFLLKVKPTLSQRVIKTSFTCVIEGNFVTSNLLKARTEEIFEKSMAMMKTQVKNAKIRFRDKLITILVKEFDNVFTAPDEGFLT